MTCGSADSHAAAGVAGADAPYVMPPTGTRDPRVVRAAGPPHSLSTGTACASNVVASSAATVTVTASSTDAVVSGASTLACDPTPPRMTSDTVSEQRRSNREQFPEIARMVDILRETFGEVRVVKLERVP